MALGNEGKDVLGTDIDGPNPAQYVEKKKDSTETSLRGLGFTLPWDVQRVS